MQFLPQVLVWDVRGSWSCEDLLRAWQRPAVSFWGYYHLRPRQLWNISQCRMELLQGRSNTSLIAKEVCKQSIPEEKGNDARMDKQKSISREISKFIEQKVAVLWADVHQCETIVEQWHVQSLCRQAHKIRVIIFDPWKFELAFSHTHAHKLLVQSPNRNDA